MARKMKRVSKDEWLQKALEVLRRQGIEAIRVERIAAELGIAKSGFYWHFRDRDDLIRQMVDYWAQEFTEVVSANLELLKGSPEARLRRIARLILDHDLTQYDLAFRAMAEADPALARRVNKVYKARLDYIGSIFRDLGFKGEELDMRTRLFVCYHSWERTTFMRQSRSSLRAMIARRIELLTRR